MLLLSLTGHRAAVLVYVSVPRRIHTLIPATNKSPGVFSHILSSFQLAGQFWEVVVTSRILFIIYYLFVFVFKDSLL